MEYAKVTDLPAAVRSALSAVSYGKPDIEVRTSVTVTLSNGGQSGRKGFATLINLATGAATTVGGSWGGANMFDTTNPVDNDHNAYPLPDNGAALTGSTGHGGTWAVLHIPASMRERMLPAAGEALTGQERDALYCYKAIKGGQYRRDEIARRKVTADTVDALISRGLLNRNKAGAVSITTDGKNALGDYRGH